jgi:hypothetical protein
MQVNIHHNQIQNIELNIDDPMTALRNFCFCNVHYMTDIVDIASIGDASSVFKELSSE